MARTAVSNEKYGRFLEENPGHRKPEQWTDSLFNQPQQPVVGVSWEEAQAYCLWAQLVLPSEAQWENALHTLEEQAGLGLGLAERTWIRPHESARRIPAKSRTRWTIGIPGQLGRNTDHRWLRRLQ